MEDEAVQGKDERDDAERDRQPLRPTDRLRRAGRVRVHHDVAHLREDRAIGLQR
jgi:hypothetical protein